MFGEIFYALIHHHIFLRHWDMAYNVDDIIVYFIMAACAIWDLRKSRQTSNSTRYLKIFRFQNLPLSFLFCHFVVVRLFPIYSVYSVASHIVPFPLQAIVKMAAVLTASSPWVLNFLAFLFFSLNLFVASWKSGASELILPPSSKRRRRNDKPAKLKPVWFCCFCVCVSWWEGG